MPGGLKWCKTDSAYIRHSIGDSKQKDWIKKIQTAWFGKLFIKETAFDLEANIQAWAKFLSMSLIHKPNIEPKLAKGA